MQRMRMPLLVAILVLAQGCAKSLRSGDSLRDSIPNFFSVDHALFRGGQPTPKGIQDLAGLGVKTVVNLRFEDDDMLELEQELVESMGMHWINMPMWALWRPSDRQVREFVHIVKDPEQQPVFVHCRKGEDRTGVLVAIWRIMNGWTPEEAYAEARLLGLTPFNPFMKYVILRESRKDYLGEYLTAQQPSPTTSKFSLVHAP